VYGPALSFLGTIGPQLLVGEGKMDPEALTDRIRELCEKAITTPSSEIEPVATELQAALREHALFAQNMAVQSLLTAETTLSSPTE
jgi:hypothetical protein